MDRHRPFPVYFGIETPLIGDAQLRMAPNADMKGIIKVKATMCGGTFRSFFYWKLVK